MPSKQLAFLSPPTAEAERNQCQARRDRQNSIYIVLTGREFTEFGSVGDADLSDGEVGRNVSREQVALDIGMCIECTKYVSTLDTRESALTTRGAHDQDRHR